MSLSPGIQVDHKFQFPGTSRLWEVVVYYWLVRVCVGKSAGGVSGLFGRGLDLFGRGLDLFGINQICDWAALWGRVVSNFEKQYT